MTISAGKRFRQALIEEKPLQIAGAINAYAAILAAHVGFKALYLSGAGVANASYGLPDLGMTTLDNVLTDVNRITSAVDLPLLVDIDTGWGNALMIGRTIKSMIRAGAGAIHIEDQVSDKRCGHRSGKAVVPKEEMVDRIKAAVDARTDSDFVIMARIDSFSIAGLSDALERAVAYEEAGADMLFPEALQTLEQYAAFKQAVRIPILANMTEFGQTPLYSKQDLSSAGVDMILYPLSAFRAMNLAALRVYQEIRQKGTQNHLLDQMQTREELYGFLNYHAHEEAANTIIRKKTIK